jgi:NIMA (never in mitosis gene a)-related kinase
MISLSSPPLPPTPQALTRARFRTLKTLGQGSFGVAYLVSDLEAAVAADAAAAAAEGAGGALATQPTQQSAERLYVIKSINISSMDAKAKRAALGECEVLSRLQHPNIVEYYGSWVEGDPPHLHILLEFCDGGDLQQAIRAARDAKAFFSEELVTSWFCQLSSAILFCHRRRVLHRDLKAGNIFLHGPGRVVKLADFGIARVLHSEGSLASTVIGTPYYMRCGERRARARMRTRASAPRRPTLARSLAH